MINCIIVDDEKNARILLHEMLADICPQLRVVAECDDLPTAVKAIKKYAPQLVFLDIEMPGHSGLEILDYFEDNEIVFDIIFCTGYSEYAIQAFKLSATDYLLKPIDPDMLKDAVERYMKKNNADKTIEYRTLQENLTKNADDSDKCIVVNLTGSTRFIKIKEIVMLQGEGSYCKIHLNNGQQLLTSKNLKYFEERLTDFYFFFRSHKSYIINLKKVLEYNKSDNEVILENKTTGMVSAEKTELFLTKMETLH